MARLKKTEKQLGYKKSKISDIIFKELIKRGYSLEGKTRIWNIADSKLWYLTPEQSQAFLNLEKSKTYRQEVIQKEIDLINKNMGDILEKVGSDAINIIDLGCGDGKKAGLFIKRLSKTAKVRYCPIDISSYMVEKAIENISKLKVGEVVKFQWNISDFENLENISSLLRQDDFKRNFILLLGNTLGNFEINEILHLIRTSMREGDLVLIGNGLSTKNPEEILESYNNKYLDELLSKTLMLIGLNRENIEYGARFRNSRVEMFYTIKNDCEISFLGKKVKFSKGDQILVAISYKYDKYDFTSFLKMYFDDIKVYASEDDSYALALCQK